MSLQVWLPFNNNINNQGVTGALTQVTAPTYVDGKIGKAMSTGAVTIPAATAAKFYNNKAMSFCFWIYTLANSSMGTPIIGQSAMAAGDNRMFSIYQYPTSADLHLSWQNETASGTFLSGIWTGYMPNNTWTHIAITYDGTTAKIYQNGVYKASASGTSARSNFSYNVPIPNCAYRYLNDLRIYDEVLSEKQIKEISKALVCHYPLDNNGSGMPNLAKGTNTASTGTNVFGYGEQTGGSSRTIEYDGGIPCAKITRNTTAHSGWAYLYYNNLDYSLIKTSTTYTVSFDIIASGSGTISFSGFQMGNGTNNMSVSTTIVQNAFNSTSWSHIVFKTITKASFDDLTLSGQLVYMNTSFLQTTETWMIMKNMKVEEGTSDTPWCPHTSDASYAVFNINGNKEIDISGYKHDGTVTTKASVTSDTPRYTCSYIFNGSTNNAFINTTTDLNFTDNFSWACWVKTNYTGTTAQYIFTVGRADSGDYGYGLQCTSTTNCRIRFGNKTYDITVTSGEWTYLAFTKSGTAIKTYKNGSVVTTATFDGTLPTYSDGAGIGIGCFHYASGNIYPYYGNISDLRIYATALSADDIAELYRASAEIDNSGNVYCNDFVEV